LLDILEAIERIERYVWRGRTEFDSDELIQTWVVHHLQLIGEACAGLTEGLRESRPGVPWRGYIGMRNILVHRYFGIDPEPVCLAATVELDALKIEVTTCSGVCPRI